MSIGTGNISNGQATYMTSALAAGSHPITATYNGDTHFLSSTSTQLSQIVNKLTPTVNVSGGTGTFGQPLALTVTVTGGNNLTPTGSVAFTSGMLMLGSGTLTPVMGMPTVATATINPSTLPAGMDGITASYGGDGNFKTASGMTTVTVNPTNATLGVASSTGMMNPTSVYGQAVMFTATLTGVNNTPPTGTVTFSYTPMGGTATQIGSAVTLTAAGMATPNVATAQVMNSSPLPVGVLTITAAYSGDTSYLSGNVTLTQTVNPATTTTTASAMPSPGTAFSTIGLGAQVTVTSPGSGTPTGTVTFTVSPMGGGMPITVGRAILDGTGKANATTVLPGGTYTITAAYSGAPNFTASDSTGNPTNEIVNPATPGVTVTSSSGMMMPTSTFGTSVTFTATVTGVNNVAPTGTVTFSYTPMGGMATPIGMPVTLTAGNGMSTATILTSNLPTGTLTITAAYNGDTNYVSVTTTLTQIVNPATPGVTVTSSSGTTMPTSTFGTPVTFTATVTGVNNVAPTGTVTFSYTPMGGTATPIGMPVMLTATAGMGISTATVMTATLPPGSDVITATYSSDNNYTAGMPGSVTQTVNKTTPGVTVTSSSGMMMPTSTFGTPVTFTATVTGVNNVAPTGTVTFTSNDGTALPAAMQSTMGADLIATVSTSALTAGARTITATYTPAMNETNYLGAMGNVAQTVNAASTTTVVVSSSGAMNPTSNVGQPVTFTATVTNTASGATPTGTITFTSSDSTVLGGGMGITLNPVAGITNQATATVTTSALSAGMAMITATFTNSDGNFTGSMSTVTQRVNRLIPTVTVVSSNGTVNPTSTFGTSVTFTATVMGVMGSVAPTGAVSFTSSNGTTLNGGMGVPLTPVPGSSPPAATTTLTTSALKVGNDTITATYAPGSDPIYTAGMAATVGQTVTAATPMVIVGSSSGTMMPTSTLGTTVTFTATVTGVNNVAPTGSIVFTSSDGTMLTGGMQTTTGANLVATVNTSALKAGSPTITATYTPAIAETNYVGATGNVTQIVRKATPTVMVTSSTMGTSNVGQSVTFTATVAGTNGVTPTGTVTFTASDGTMLPAAMQSTTGANLTATVSTSVLKAGMLTISATYSGDANFATGTAGTVMQTVNRLASTTTVSSPATSVPQGVSVTLTATVHGAMGAPTPMGNIVFTSGTSMLGMAMLDVSGSASVHTTALPTGMNTVTASYNGDATYTPSSGTTTQTVTGAVVTGITVTVPTGSGSGNSGTATMPRLTPGGSLPLTAQGSYTNGMTGSVNGLTFTVTSGMNVVSVSPGGIVTALAPGTATITITAPGGVTTTITMLVIEATGTGLVPPNPQPMTHAGTPSASTTPAPQPAAHPVGNGSGGGVQPHMGDAPTATPIAQPSRH